MQRFPAIQHCTATSALGCGIAMQRQALLNKNTGLTHCDFDGVDLDTWIGRVSTLEDNPITGALAHFDCRNNRLAQLALEQDDFQYEVRQVRGMYGSHRVGVFLGTSTSGVQQAEMAYAARDKQGKLPDSFRYTTTQNTFSVTDYVRRVLGLNGPAMVVSTACSSSAKVFATAWRYMKAGLCDAAVVGGVDSLCQMTLYGFNALQLVSSTPCRPADQLRDGISIGEAAGFALLVWSDDADIALLGCGESSDAYHMSTPHPEGEGAFRAMRQALQTSQLQPEQLDYINLHGTATKANDLSEDKAVQRLFNDEVPCSSTKGFSGHTLGAAGILEAVFAWISVESGFLPASLNTQSVDDAIHSNILLDTRHQIVNLVMTNSFGFGGSNASLIIGRPT